MPRAAHGSRPGDHCPGHRALRSVPQAPAACRRAVHPWPRAPRTPRPAEKGLLFAPFADRHGGTSTPRPAEGRGTLSAGLRYILPFSTKNSAKISHWCALRTSNGQWLGRLRWGWGRGARYQAMLYEIRPLLTEYRPVQRSAGMCNGPGGVQKGGGRKKYAQKFWCWGQCRSVAGRGIVGRLATVAKVCMPWGATARHSGKSWQHFGTIDTL